MSVTTGNKTITLNPISANQFMLKVSASGTGDGTGGSIFVPIDITDFIPAGASVEVIDAVMYNNSAAAEKMSLQLSSSEWSMGIGSLLAFHADDVKEMQVSDTPTAYFFLGKQSALANFPLYLGKRLGSTVTLTIGNQTNTNTKVTQAVVRFKVTMPP